MKSASSLPSFRTNKLIWQSRLLAIHTQTSKQRHREICAVQIVRQQFNLKWRSLKKASQHQNTPVGSDRNYRMN